MARIVCEDSLSQNEGGVIEFCSWLKEALPDDYLVFHNLDNTFVSLKGGVKQGESDILVVAVPYGLLNIEIKSHGEIRQDADLTWHGKSRKGKWTKFQDPFNQSNNTIWLLVAKIEQVLRRERTKLPFVWGHAVAFPNVVIENSDYPINAPRELTYDSTDRKQIRQRIEETFAVYSKNRPNKKPTEADFSDLVDRVLMPGYRAVRLLADQIEAYEPKYVRATDSQCRTLGQLENNPRMLIEGCPGSGKTLLAMRRAEQLSSEGKSVLFLCYNVSLGDFLRMSLNGLPNVDIYHYHGLARELSTGAGLSGRWSPPGKDGSIEKQRWFWNEEANALLAEAQEIYARKGSEPKYDALIVDEAQDFMASWYSSITRFLKDPDKGSLYAFSGPEQMLFRKAEEALPSVLAEDRLFFKWKMDCNCRNSKRIGRLLADLLGAKFHSEDFCAEGPPVQYWSYARVEDQRKILESALQELITVQGLDPRQIVVLTCHSRGDFLERMGKTVCGHQMVEYEARHTEGAVRFSSVAAYKGLDSDAVILCDIDWDPVNCDTWHLATGISRAKHVLCLLFQGDWRIKSHRPGRVKTIGNMGSLNLNSSDSKLGAR